MPRAAAVPSIDCLFARLSPRRREILDLVTKGLTNDDIAGCSRGARRLYRAA